MKATRGANSAWTRSVCSPLPLVTHFPIFPYLWLEAQRRLFPPWRVGLCAIGWCTEHYDSGTIEVFKLIVHIRLRYRKHTWFKPITCRKNRPTAINPVRLPNQRSACRRRRPTDDVLPSVNPRLVVAATGAGGRCAGCSIRFPAPPGAVAVAVEDVFNRGLPETTRRLRIRAPDDEFPVHIHDRWEGICQHPELQTVYRYLLF